MSARLLPPNSTPLERALAGTPDEARLSPETVARLWDPAACPAPALPWLAWALSVDEWDGDWDEPAQRRVIAQSIPIHRKKGTRGAVEQALACLGHAGYLTEWWQAQPIGEPHTFRADVEIDSRGIGIAAQQAIERQIAAVKPARSHFALRLIGATHARARLGAATLSGEDIAIYPRTAAQADTAPARLTLGAALHAWETVTLTPLAP